MKRVLFSLVIGSFFGYYARKMQDDGQFDCILDGAQKFFSKSKKNLRNVADVAKNEVGYIGDRIEDKLAK